MIKAQPKTINLLYKTIKKTINKIYHHKTALNASKV
jgi:hypothetical protein